MHPMTRVNLAAATDKLKLHYNVIYELWNDNAENVVAVYYLHKV